MQTTLKTSFFERSPLLNLMKKYSYPPEKIKILLLEGIDSSASERFKAAGYSVTTVSYALNDEALGDAIKDVHILGIRSKTEVRAHCLAKAKHLLAVGCFCIGTNQVDLEEAALVGAPVFNAPFGNTRSVAELVIAEVVMLARKVAHKSMDLHRGVWNKSAKGSFEVRGKTIGIVGYGHIGPQVGLLAEAFGMRVIFYDLLPKLPLGNAVRASSLHQVLNECDFLTLHVPETTDTTSMIGEEELRAMKRGSYVLNLSRGRVVNIDALTEALKSGHISGAAFDVFPEEPASNDEPFTSPLRGLPQVILTPHIGGATEEAQTNIGLEVSESLLRCLELGTTTGAVNFPQVELPLLKRSHRMLNIHKNVPGVLTKINKIISSFGVNIHSQYLSTHDKVGYLIVDIERELSHEVKEQIDQLEDSIRTRLLF
jgi:D-3-phosphoglycerate dehydrogenase / 2-oxoglutarate reductase